MLNDAELNQGQPHREISLNMKRAFLLLLPAVLLVFLSIAGCNDETEPKFSRIRVYPECGVAPMLVDCLAITTGGDESGDPTGGNNNMTISWNFGDGGTSSTSISYHTFQLPGQYTVVATGEDPDGKTTSISQVVNVMADTLAIEVSSSLPDGFATTNDTIQFDVWALSCEINPEVDDDYRNLIFNWAMDDYYTVTTPDGDIEVEYEFSSRQPRFNFSEAGTYNVTVSVTYPALAATRQATLVFEVVSP